MQLDNIAKSFKEITAAEPVLVEALPGGLHYGARASRAGERPFGIFTVVDTDRVSNSSGVALVTYEIELTVVVNEQVGRCGFILGLFDKYWGRVINLPTLGDPRDMLVIPPYAGVVVVGEADEKELGKDVILGVASWTIKVSEHKPALEE